MIKNVAKMWQHGHLRIFFETSHKVHFNQVQGIANFRGWRVIEAQDMSKHLQWECQQIKRVYRDKMEVDQGKND